MSGRHGTYASRRARGRVAPRGLARTLCVVRAGALRRADWHVRFASCAGLNEIPQWRPTLGLVPVIRLACLDDAVEIGRVHVAAWRTTYTALLGTESVEAVSEERRVAQWGRALSDASPQSVFVAEEDGRILGFASCGPSAHRMEPFDAELYTLYLLEEAQGRGLGAALLNASVARLLERGFSAMLVWVLESNASAVAFYRRFGGEYLKSAPNPMDDHPDAVYGYRDLRALERATSRYPAD